MTSRSTWSEVAAGVYVWREHVLDVNAVLVVGGEGAVVVDTLSTLGQAGAFAAAVRAVTPLPWQVVNTHGHFDHWFGNAVLAPDARIPVWAQRRCVARYAGGGTTLVEQVAATWQDTEPALAVEVAAVTPRPPDREVREHVTLDLGGRTVDLRHLGRGHTDHDLVVVVPDAGVVCLGDLVEEGASPSFDDAYPLDWPATLAAALRQLDGLPDGPLVPGHGAVVDAGFARAQHAQLTTLEWLCREGHADSAPAAEVAARSPFGPDASLIAVERAYADLDGRL